MSWEIEFLKYIRENMTGPVLDKIMVFITSLGNAGIFWILLSIVLLIPKKTRRTGMFMAIALLIDVILCNGIIKPIVGRIRPYEVAEGIDLIIKKPTDSSFPSGHTAASFAAAVAILFSGRRLWGSLAIVLAALIAFSRLYLFVHYPTDVICGLILGILCAVAAYFIMKYNEKKMKFLQ